MKKELKYLILFSLITLVGCGNEEDVVSGIVPPQPGDVLELTVSAADFVTDGAPDTRATDNGKETTFEDGDRVGIIILDENSQPIYDNIPYIYKNGSWTFDSNNGVGKERCYYDTKADTYIVYYPYRHAADGLTSINDLKANFTPKYNRNDIEDYRSSNLMVWSNNTHLTSSENKLNVKLTHAFASIDLTPKVKGKYILEDGIPYTGNYVPEVSDISDVSLTIDNAVYVPFHMTDGTLRCIVPADITPDNIRCFYTTGSNTYGNTISISGTGKVAANTRYASEPTIENIIYSLGNARVGDFYCRKSDNKGYLIPGDVTALSPDQQAACLGIVMKVGKDDIGDWRDDCNYKYKDNSTPMNTIHGYVLALFDANGGNTCQWSSFKTLVNTITHKTGFYGYKNTQTIISFNGGNDLSTAFSATYLATTDYDDKYPAPANSSGWFLPSAGEGRCWINNRQTLLTQVRKATGDDSYNWKNWYWMSSESDSFFGPTDRVHLLDFYYGSVSDTGKDYTNHYVRSCLAF